MNIYRMTFTATCPVDGEQIAYSLEIVANDTIRAEDIEATVPTGTVFHEDLADLFFDKFGGKQTIRARHGRVDIETFRSH